jgi:hypothetical protein
LPGAAAAPAAGAGAATVARAAADSGEESEARRGRKRRRGGRKRKRGPTVSAAQAAPEAPEVTGAAGSGPLIPAPARQPGRDEAPATSEVPAMGDNAPAGPKRSRRRRRRRGGGAAVGAPGSDFSGPAAEGSSQGEAGSPEAKPRPRRDHDDAPGSLARLAGSAPDFPSPEPEDTKA